MLGGWGGCACVIFPCDSHGDEPRHKESLFTQSERHVHAQTRAQSSVRRTRKDGCLPVAMSSEEVSVLGDWELQHVNALHPHQTAAGSSAPRRFFMVISFLLFFFFTHHHHDREQNKSSSVTALNSSPPPRSTLSPAPPTQEGGEMSDDGHKWQK